MKLMQKLLKICSEKKPLRFLLSRLLWKTGLCRFFLIKCNGFKLRFYPTALSCGLWENPKLRQKDEQFFLDYLKEGDVVIDIGANIGSLAILAAQNVGSNGKVIAFEPHPKIFKYLNNNIALNRMTNITTHHLALGASVQTAFLSNLRLDDMNSIVSHKHHALPVIMDTLDNVCKSPTKPIALIKLDVEGFEKFILEEACETLNHTSCLYLESSEDHFKQYGYSSSDLFHLIRHFGFILYSIQKPGVLSFTPLSWISHVGENLIAIKNREDFISRTGYSLTT